MVSYLCTLVANCRFWWIRTKPNNIAPTNTPVKIQPTHKNVLLTNGSTKKPPWGAGTCIWLINVSTDTIAEDNIIIEITRRGSFAANGIDCAGTW